MNLLKSLFSVCLLTVMSFGTLVAISLPAKADFDCMINCVNAYNDCMFWRRIFCRIQMVVSVQTCMATGMQGCMENQQNCRNQCDFPCPI